MAFFANIFIVFYCYVSLPNETTHYLTMTLPKLRNNEGFPCSDFLTNLAGCLRFHEFSYISIHVWGLIPSLEDKFSLVFSLYKRKILLGAKPKLHLNFAL